MKKLNTIALATILSFSFIHPVWGALESNSSNKVGLISTIIKRRVESTSVNLSLVCEETICPPSTLIGDLLMWGNLNGVASFILANTVGGIASLLLDPFSGIEENIRVEIKEPIHLIVLSRSDDNYFSKTIDFCDETKAFVKRHFLKFELTASLLEYAEKNIGDIMVELSESEDAPLSESEHINIIRSEKLRIFVAKVGKGLDLDAIQQKTTIYVGNKGVVPPNGKWKLKYISTHIAPQSYHIRFFKLNNNR